MVDDTARVVFLGVERERRSARSLGLAGAEGDVTPEDLRALADKFEQEIGGAYQYVAAALRQQAADREKGSHEQAPADAPDATRRDRPDRAQQDGSLPEGSPLARSSVMRRGPGPAPHEPRLRAILGGSREGRPVSGDESLLRLAGHDPESFDLLDRLRERYRREGLTGVRIALDAEVLDGEQAERLILEAILTLAEERGSRTTRGRRAWTDFDHAEAQLEQEREVDR